MVKKNTGPKIQEEKRTIRAMIDIYYKNHEATKINKQMLLSYSHLRLDVCRFGEEKPTCKQCPVHCYRPDYKEQMKQVMRYSGPRMLLYHPVLAVKHLLKENKSKKSRQNLGN
nr:nitrous oxide-stimulated promoter family protein [Enterococcus caccae]